MLLATLTLPGVVLLTPLFATTTALNVYNTYWAVILPLAALQVPFAVLLTRNFIDGIPDELIDASRIDGASTLKGFWYIVLPLTRPIAAAIIVFTLIGAWNDYLFPLVFLVDPSTQTITQLPQFFVGQFSNDQTKVLAVRRDHGDPRGHRLPVPAGAVRARSLGRRAASDLTAS